ncbi:MAG: glycosyltransferase [Thermoanaerobaculia bacterium]
MTVAWLSPLPPVRSGIAGYSAMLLPEIAKRVDVTAVVGQDAWSDAGVPVIHDSAFDPSKFDTIVCQLGNNPHHEFVYRRALETPSIVVLHDLVLHHLIVEMTLARGDREGYIDAMRRNHGEAGAAWAAGRAAGFHTELANFLFPASIEIARKARAVIVHNRYAAETLRSFGVETPIAIVEHPYVTPAATDRAATRRALGYRDDAIVVGMFGFVTAAKRPEVVFEAFARAIEARAQLRLLVVGEPAPDVDLEALAREFGIPAGSWRALGFVSDDVFTTYLDAVDCVVNLRYPSAGETSGALVHVFGAGKPVAVSDYAQFGGYPADLVTRIPFDDEVPRLVEFMTGSREDARRAARQRTWLNDRASLASAAQHYLDVANGRGFADCGEPRAAAFALPLFPMLTLEQVHVSHDGKRWIVELSLRNDAQPLSSWRFGEPEYRVLAKAFDGDREIADAWLRLPGDLATGDSARLEFAFESDAARPSLCLLHAIEGLPHCDLPPFATAELSV